MTADNKKPLGFTINEVMTGEHRFEPGFGPEGTRTMEFKGVWGAEDLGKFLDPGSKSFFSAFLNGTVTIDGLCMDAPMAGTLELRYVTERRIRYTFDFEAKGKAYHFVGEKVNILPWNLLFSHTTCFGRLTEKKTGKLVSTSVTFFKLASALKFLASFRLKKSVA